MGMGTCLQRVHILTTKSRVTSPFLEIVATTCYFTLRWTMKKAVISDVPLHINAPCGRKMLLHKSALAILLFGHVVGNNPLVDFSGWKLNDIC